MQVYTKYIARERGGYCELMVNHDAKPNDIREAIDRANEKAKDLGYAPVPYLICKVETFFTEEKDESGLLKSSTSTIVTTAIELYPPIKRRKECRPSGIK